MTSSFAAPVCEPQATHLGRCRIVKVVARHDAVGLGCGCNRVCQDARRVETASVCHQPVAGAPPIGRLEAYNAAEAGRQPDAPARVRAQRQRDQPRRNRRGAATRAATCGPRRSLERCQGVEAAAVTKGEYEGSVAEIQLAKKTNKRAAW